MAVKKYKPTSAGRRFRTVSDFSEITTSTPEKSLLDKKPSTGGRNAHGRMTARHRGAGHKRRYRIIDFRRNKDGVPATVASIEYDPNRNARIALLNYHDGEKRYIIAPLRLSVGDVGRVGCARRDQAGQRPATAEHPSGYQRARGGAPSGRWRQAGPSRRNGHSARCQGGFSRPVEAPLRRDAQCSSGLPGHRRPGRQPRGRADEGRQGGPQSVEGCSPSDPRRRHEPGGPSARRWRRQGQRWAPSGEPLGQARGAHPQEAQGERPLDRAAPGQEGKEELMSSTSVRLFFPVAPVTSRRKGCACPAR